MTKLQLSELAEQIKSWGKQLGFQSIGIADTQLESAERFLLDWLSRGYHGTMRWMAEHGTKRSRPAELHPGTLRIITARLDYWPAKSREPWSVLHDAHCAYISRYALGRDYHKLMRARMQKLADTISHAIGKFNYRVFCDSAPVLEKPLAENSGLGWIGKHTNVIHRDHGSYFFLGELYTDLPLPIDAPTQNHCGTCSSCIDACPTGAIVAPYQLDARRCISYLTIELQEAIPVELRPLIGNRIYGCDDCQLVCPWNRFSQPCQETDFAPRHQLDDIRLLDLFNWNEQIFLNKTEGSAIRRIGYVRWIRNIAVALGNAPRHDAIINALQQRAEDPNDLIREHVQWALTQQLRNSHDPS